MKTYFVTLVVLTALLIVAGCSDDDGSPASPDPLDATVSFREVPNTALYGGADYEGMLLSVRGDGSVGVCQAICEADPECTFFYFNARGRLALEPLTTQRDDCVFFRGQLGSGRSQYSDTYVKQVDGVDAWEVERARF
jgi:hypothetical protein